MNKPPPDFGADAAWLDMEKGVKLPWRCEDHPDAPILHTWDQDHYVFNGYPAGIGFNKRGHKYQCNVCLRELAPPTNNQLHQKSKEVQGE